MACVPSERSTWSAQAISAAEPWASSMNLPAFRSRSYLMTVSLGNPMELSAPPTAPMALPTTAPAAALNRVLASAPRMIKWPTPGSTRNVEPNNTPHRPPSFYATTIAAHRREETCARDGQYNTPGKCRAFWLAATVSPPSCLMLFLRRSVSADVIALADFHAVVAEDVVSGGDVEEEVLHAVVQQVGFAGETLFLWRARTQHDFTAVGAVELFRLEAVDEGDGFVQARLQVGEAGFVVFVRRHFDIGQARRHAFGEVGGDLHLAGQVQHVREQARLQEGIGVDVLGGGVGFGFFQDFLKRIERLLEDRDGSRVVRDGHDFPLVCCQCTRHAYTSVSALA